MRIKIYGQGSKMGKNGIKIKHLLTMSLQTRYRNKRVNVTDSQLNAQLSRRDPKLEIKNNFK